MNGVQDLTHGEEAVSFPGCKGSVVVVVDTAVPVQATPVSPWLRHALLAGYIRLHRQGETARL